MNLPSQAQVNAATRHVASFAAGAITMFGLSAKIDPTTIVAIINSLGTLTNDAVVLIGLVTPLIAGYFASRSASTANQTASAIAADPKGVIAAVNALPAAAVTVSDPALASPGVKIAGQ